MKRKTSLYPMLANFSCFLGNVSRFSPMFSRASPIFSRFLPRKRQNSLTRLRLENLHLTHRCVFFGIEMSFLWYRGGLSLIFGVEISFLVSRFCVLSLRIKIVCFLGSARVCSFWPRHPVSWRSKRSRYRKEDRKISMPQTNILTPTKRVTP